MIRNELTQDTAIETETTTAASEAITEPQPVSVSTYKIGNTTYKVSVFFNPNGTETLEEMLDRLIMKDIAKLSA